ncbi:MAG: DUF1919 domain-containing protein [Bacteroidota bacterium]
MLTDISFIKFFLDRNARKLKNKNFTILCNNCIGGIILHDLKLKFNTPTINLYFNAPDYIAFLERLEYYLSTDITFSYQSKYDTVPKEYPVGTISDIELHFVHYNDFSEAKNKWTTRAKRVNYNNLFVIGSDKDYFTPDLLTRFLRLPYRNKVFFSSRKNAAREVVFFKEYENEKEVADLIQHDHAWYFHFDVVKWLNTGEIKRYHFITSLFLFYRYIRKKYNARMNVSEK